MNVEVTSKIELDREDVEKLLTTALGLEKPMFNWHYASVSSLTITSTEERKVITFLQQVGEVITSEETSSEDLQD